MTRQHWLTGNLFALLPDTARIAVDPGFFADNYMNLIPVAAQLACCRCRRAPGATHRRAYRPTGPALLSATEIAEAIGEALGRRVRHIAATPPARRPGERPGTS